MNEQLPTLSFDPTDWSNPLSEFLIKKKKIIDVRAPIEFREGHLPGSMNLPILEDEERAEIGTLYKKEGREAAIKRGYELVSGENRNQKMQLWLQAFASDPNSLITCFRGGQRSQITQKWISESGLSPLRLEGGYKKARQFLLSVLDQIPLRANFIVLSGRTGSAKTKVIDSLAKSGMALRLEELAKHRGSAFGQKDEPQPAQAEYENELATQFLSILSQQNVLSSGKAQVFVEDESRMIGKITQPEKFFIHLRSSPIVLIEEPLERRVENIFQDYILETAIGDFLQARQNPNIALKQDLPYRCLLVFEKLTESMKSISKKLGGKETAELLNILSVCRQEFENDGSVQRNKEWIARLLTNYYDRFYEKSLETRNPLILFRGPAEDVKSWCQEVKSSRFSSFF